MLTGCFFFGLHVESKGRTEDNSGGQARPRQAAPACDLSDLPNVAPGERLPLAVLDFRVGEDMDDDTGRALADLCRDSIQPSGRYVLVDRERIAAILGERDFADAVACDSVACYVEYGKLLGARKMVHGRINELGDVYVLAVGMTDVDTTRQVSRSASLEDVEDATETVPDLVCEVIRAACDGDE
jgi:hypothetical protein